MLLLDDVFAELDAGRREQLALAAAKAEQVIVTAAVARDVPEHAGRRACTTGSCDGDDQPCLKNVRRDPSARHPKT